MTLRGTFAYTTLRNIVTAHGLRVDKTETLEELIEAVFYLTVSPVQAELTVSP